jgi:phosphonate transport system substrate-binding protein
MRFIYLSLTSLLLTAQLIHADIIMGVVPQQSPLKLQKVWQPIAEYLSDKTGQKVIFKTERSIAEFEKVLYSGGYDFAYMSPYHYVVAHKKQAYHAKVRADKNIRGILVMKKGTGIERLKSKDTRYLFPSPNAFAATLLTKYDLIETYKVDPKVLQKARYVNSHDSVYKAISRDIGDVGGGIERTFRNMNDAQTKDNLHVVHTTKAYPSHPFAFKSDLGEEKTQRIVEALLQMPAALLQALSIKALHQIDDSEYKSVEKLAVLLNIMPE